MAPGSPPPAPVATPASGLRSFAYYPEQLAALASLNSFHPAADPGLASQRLALAAPEKDFAPNPAREAAKPSRRVAPASRGAPIQPLQPSSSPTEATVEPAPRSEWKIFGLRVPAPAWPNGEALRQPAEQVRGAAVGLKDKAAALGDRIATLWR